MDFQSCATFYQDSSETWGAVGEAFHIDDLLDFSNDDIGAPIQNDEENSSDYTEVSAGSVERNYSSSVTQVTEELPAAELCVPMDTLADLEWLSTFVEDSFMPELPPGCGPAREPVPSTDGNKTDSGDNKEIKPQSYKISYISPCNWIPVKARSKRSRTGCRVWSFNNPLLPANPGFESDGVVFTQSSDSSCSDSSQPRPTKKYKKSHSKKAQDGSQPRRCSHCLVQKTPQWRAGPLGPKTLCNACGVRFKSGRLVPEYRPAISPTFLTEVHSNSHRKILEMRRQKEEEEQRSDITSQTCSNGGNESFFGNSLPSQEPIRV